MIQATELYIYYRVQRSARSIAHAEIVALQAGLCRRWPGLQARLLARADEAAANPGAQATEATWMEVYHCPGGCAEGALADVLAAGAAWPGARRGPRVIERFLPLNPELS